MDIEYTPPGKSSGRKAYRASIPGLKVRVNPEGRIHPVLNLSSEGLAIHLEGRRFSQDQLISLDLVLSCDTFLADVKAKVVRLDDETAGVSFLDLSKHDQSMLDKLVLEVQKRMISKRKREGEEG